MDPNPRKTQDQIEHPDVIIRFTSLRGKAGASVHPVPVT